MLMSMAMDQIIVAILGCIFVFFLSHFFWRWRSKRKKELAVPIFSERLFLALAFYFATSHLTGWSEQFAIAMLITYFILLIGYTWYIYRKYYRAPHQPSGDKKSYDTK